MGDRTAPNCQLRLEWVYGYRGHQVRSNLYYNKDHEIVYFVAGVGIVYNQKEHKQNFFLEHDDDIISLTLHPDQIQVASGQVGKSPQIIVWDTKTLKPTSILKGGHTEGVGILCFDSKGERLASCGIDQDSTIAVWDWKKGKLLAKSSGHQERVFDLQFSLFKDNALVSCGVKQISFWTLIGNTLQKKKGIFGQTKDITTMFSLSFSKEKDKEIYYTGTINGQVYVWKGNQLEEILPNVHESSIFTLTDTSDGYVTAGKDGLIRTWDGSFHPIDTINLRALLNKHENANLFYANEITIRSVYFQNDYLLIGTQSSEIFQINMKDPTSVECLCNGHSEGELWSLAVSPADKNVFATASDDKTLRVWDLKENKLIKITQLDKRVRSCSFSSDGKSIACGQSDGSLVIINTDDMSKKVLPKLRNEVLHEMKYSPCGKYLAVGSNDNFVDIYSVPDYKRLGVCTGNSSFITHLDWSNDSKYIQTNSGDGQRLIYKCPKGEQVTNSNIIKSIAWKTFTGVLGDEVVGIWEKYTNKTDVNATDAYFDEKCLVSGDDFGLVKLFRFPSLKKGAKFRKYVGHSSHVTNVRFTKDKTRVISIGGADHAIFQWRFIPENATTDTSREEDGGLNENDENAKIDTPKNYQAYLDSNSEESDSELSGKEIDSDIENEKQLVYDRDIYKDDLIALKPKVKEEIKKAESEMRFKRQNRPDVSLGIEFVFGYRGYDCRDNLFYIHETGLIVYHVAALGIVYNKETQLQRYYNQHTDDILCLCVHYSDSKKNICATGQIGRDPAIHVWDVESMKTLSILKGEHYRGVCSVSFSSDGKKLASVGLDDNHVICVWDWKKGEKLATTRGHKDKIFSIKWNPHGGDKLVTVGVKHIKFWNQVGGGFTSNRGLFGKLSGVENMMCIAFGKDPNLCYTGGGNGSIFVWIEQKLTKVIQAHTGPIFAIYAHERSEAYVTGGKDGCIMLWDENFNQIHKYSLNKNSLLKQTKGVLLTDQPSVRAICFASKRILIGTKNGEIIDIDKDGNISIVTQGHGEGEVWGLSCHPKRLECCTASDDKTVRTWSLEPNKRYMLNGRVFDKPLRACAYSNDGNLIVVGFKEGTVCVLKAENLELIEKINHRNQEISDIKFSDSGKYVAIGSHENTIDVYNVNTRKRVGICKGASSYITHIEWDAESKLLMTNSGAKELLYFEAPRGNRVNIRSEDVEKIQWSTFTSVLGPTCIGIWPPCTDVTDVNSTCLNKYGNCLATGDDFGLVKLFEYPCLNKFAKFKKYNGHSSHVTNVRWALNDAKLVSTGGNDTSVIIWNNFGYVEPTEQSDNLNASSVRSAELVQRNMHRGESEDSDTDSENEGYDSDVRHEYEIDYNKLFFDNQIKRPTVDAIKNIYNEVATTDKMESSKPSRMVKTKFKRTKIRQMKNKDGQEVDPLTIIHFMSKMTLLGDMGQQNSQSSNYDSFKTDIKGLKLSYVHGYRGFDCRDNLFYINDGTAIVYHAAAAGIVLDLVKNTQSFYLEHTDDIISLCVNEHPKFKNVIATGQIGKSSAIHIWDALTKEQYSILTGQHKDVQGVCSLGFSSSGRLLVSVGLDDKYTICVWRWKEGSLVASAIGDHKPNRIFRVMFRPDSDSVFVSVGFKHVKFWNVAGSELIKKRGVLTDCNTKDKLKKMPTMLSVAFGQNNVTYTGSMTGEVFIWKDNVLTRVISDAHRGPIFTMYTTLFDGCIVTGAKEKKKRNCAPVKIWDKDMKKCLKSYFVDKESEVVVVKSVCRSKNKILVGTKSSSIYEISEKMNDIENVISGHGEGNFHGLCVHPTKEIFCTASYDGYVRIWDIKTKKLISKHYTDREVHSVDFSPDGNMLALGFSDGQIVLLKCTNNYENLEKCDSNRQRKACVTDIKFSPHDVKSKRLAAGLSDCSIDFLAVSDDEKLNRIGYCKQVPGPVSVIDWSTLGDYIKVSTTNHKRIVFNVPDGTEIKLESIQDKVEWYQWTSIFDPEVIGIWSGYDVKAENHVNCAHLAAHAMKLAIGDDDGAVKLFKFPCLDKDEQSQSYYGHSSYVTNVKFLNSNSHLISIGGLDCCVFVWECE